MKTITCLLALTGGMNAAIINPSFEAAGTTGQTLANFPDFIINATIPSWTSISLGPDLYDASTTAAPYTSADDGNNYVGFTQPAHGMFQTLLGLTAGATYEITFAQAGGTAFNDPNYAFISAAGTTAQVAVYDSTQTFASLDVLSTAGALGSTGFTFSTPTIPASGAIAFVPDWATESFTFVAPADGDVTLYVNVGATNDPGQVLYDDFTLTIVPEPTSSALLGLGFLGLLARRRK